MGFVVPESIRNSGAIRLYEESLETAIEAYKEMVASGIRKEDARFVLPQAAQTEMYMTGNFQAWFDFLVRRLDKHAQWEVRLVASMIYGYLRNVAPNIFNAETVGVTDAEIYGI